MRTTAQRAVRLVALAAAIAAAPCARAEMPRSLDQVPVPEPARLALFVKDRAAAIRLGKALFWDAQVGSDARTACATCHFHAGADNRRRNTLARGADASFGVSRPNGELRPSDFPFHRLQDPEAGGSPVLQSRDDVVGSQGIVRGRFEGAGSAGAREPSLPERDPVFHRNGRNVRQVTGRNAPSVVNAIFNVASFWDGRAHPFFNGVNPFGILDQGARVLVDGPGGPAPVSLVGDLATNPWALDNAALASQAVGPPMSDVEMSWAGRTWPDLGRKLLPLRPLAGQRVHPADSSLGALAAQSGTGLATTYGDLVRAAFRDELWRSPAVGADGFSQIEANFSLFFGLAVQLYEATLVADDTPFDRFLRGDARALTDRQQRGMNLFFSGGTACAFCHAGPELTAASFTQIRAPGEPGMIEQMTVADGSLANYDIGFYNVGVRPVADDPGRGARVLLGGVDTPLSFTGQWFERATLPFAPLAQPGCVNDFLADPPNVCPPPTAPVTAQAVLGAFKTPGLRNVELTGPYMHDGGMATLAQVVDFYVRGGNFRSATLDPFFGVPGLVGDEEKQAELVDFLLALTDERVRWEQAPFDHPQLLVPDGHEARPDGHPKRARVLADRLTEIPAVGAAGRRAQALPPLKPFLADELTGAALADFHFQH